MFDLLLFSKLFCNDKNFIIRIEYDMKHQKVLQELCLRFNTFSKNITYKTRVDLFSNYLNKPQNINFFMTNQLSCKISKYFSVTYSLDMIYDDNVRLFGEHGDAPGLQIKSLIGIGFLKPLNVKKR